MHRPMSGQPLKRVGFVQWQLKLSRGSSAAGEGVAVDLELIQRLQRLPLGVVAEDHQFDVGTTGTITLL